MHYPKLCSWILFKKQPDGMYSVKDCYTDSEYTLGSTIAYFASHLDGKTDPFSVLPDYPRCEVQEMLDNLNKFNFLRYGRVLDSSKRSFAYSVIIPRKIRTKSILPVLFSYCILLSWLPTLMYGVYMFYRCLPDIENGSILLGQWTAILCGAVLHESSHVATALGHGARVFEAGIMLHNYMPGCYVMIDDRTVRGKFRKVHILLSGVLMNFFLTGIGLLLCVYYPTQSGFFFGFALNNFLLGLFNLTFYDGLDGMAAMGKLLGTDSIVSVAKYTLKNRDERQKLLKAGPHGLAEMFICILIVALQGITPCIYFMFLLEVIECFF